MYIVTKCLISATNNVKQEGDSKVHVIDKSTESSILSFQLRSNVPIAILTTLCMDRIMSLSEY